MSLSVGKLRGLQQCTTPDGLFLITALDQRQALRAALNPTNPDSISFSELALFKTELSRALSAVSSAVLLDPEFGAAPAIAANAIAGSCGLIVSLEANGPTAKPTARKSQILPGWSVEQTSRMGAAAVKFMLMYNPAAKNAEDQELLVREVAAMCRDYDIPFLLEPVLYAAEDEATLGVETARRLAPLGADVYIATLPGPDREPAWESAARALDAACPVPWIIRGGDAPFDVFTRQAEVACRAGASGVLAGTAVWQEAVALRGDQQLDFVHKTAVSRLVELGDLIVEHATPWTDIHQSSPADIPADWYENY